MSDSTALNCHGPFALADFIGGAVPEVGNQTGVYLWCPRLPDGTYKVWYVGKAEGAYGFCGRHYDYRRYSHSLRLDLDAYERGEWQEVASSESDRDFWDGLYNRTHLFLLPVEKKSALAAESAIIRHLGKRPELRGFMWNYWIKKNGGATYHEFPCTIRCAEFIHGLDTPIAG